MYKENLFFPAVFPVTLYFFPVFPCCVSGLQGKVGKGGFRFVSLHCRKEKHNDAHQNDFRGGFGR